MNGFLDLRRKTRGGCALWRWFNNGSYRWKSLLLKIQWEKMAGLNYVWVLLPQAPCAQAALLGCSSCDAFSLPLFHSLDMTLPSLCFPAVPCEDFTWCLSVLHSSPPAEYCVLPLPSGITKLFIKLLRWSSRLTEPAMLYLGPYILFPQRGRWDQAYLPYTSLMSQGQGNVCQCPICFSASKCLESVGVLHSKTKSVLCAAGCLCSNMKLGFWG